MSSDKKSPDMNEKTQKPLTPQQISSSFVRQYYATLAQDPDNLHRFYKEDSSFSHLFYHEHKEAVKGLENIKEKINGLVYKGSSVLVALSIIDVQESLNGCILVVVQGNISKDNGKTYRPFYQSFYLAPQSPKGYYVVNDVCRFLPEEIKQSKSEEEQDASDAVSNAATAGTHLSTQSTSSQELNHVEEKPKEQKPKEKKQQKQKQPPQQKKEQKEKPAPVPTEQQPKKEDGPKTYASVVGGENYVAPQQQQQNQQQQQKKKKRNRKQKKKNEVKEGDKQTTEQKDDGQKKRFNKKQGEQQQQDRRRQNGRQYAHAIFINNIPEGLKNEDLIKKFEDCGKVLDANIHYKGEANYAFVYFETEDGVLNALKPERKVVINGVALNVQKRRSRPNKRRFWKGRRGGQDRREFRNRRFENKGGQRKTFKKTGQEAKTQ